VGTQVGVCHLLGSGVDCGSHNGMGSMVDNRGGEGMVDKGGSMVSKRGSLDNRFKCFHNRLGDNRGGGSKGIVVVVQVVSIGIGIGIGISRVGIGRVGIGRVGIGGVGGRITIVIVVIQEVGISLGLSISLGFSLSLTALSAIDRGGAIGGGRKTGGESSSQSTASLGDTVMGSETDNGGMGKGSSNNRGTDNSGGMVDNGSYSMVVSREGEGNGGSMDGVRNLSGVLNNSLNHRSIGNWVGGGKDGEGGGSFYSIREGRGIGGRVEEELGISLGFTLM
jgi:hypothetical protein